MLRNLRPSLSLVALMTFTTSTSAQIYIAPTPGSNETRTWDSGTLDNHLYVGYMGNGTFQQNGGTVNGAVEIASYRSATGTYLLAGGVHTYKGGARIGYVGAGTFIQSGGTNSLGSATLAGVLTLADGSGSSGTYILNGAAAVLSADYEQIGHHDRGTFIQSAGFNQVRSECVVGWGWHGSSYDLSGGSLSVGSQLTVGLYGRGTFNHTGGTVTVGTESQPASTSIGPLGSGTYNLSGEGASLTVWGNELVGGYTSGLGQFFHSAGTHRVSGDLSINGNGCRYTLDGGTLAVGGFEIIDVQGAFVQSGGSNTAGSRLVVGASASYLLNGGILSTPTLDIYPPASFTWSGGSLAVSTLSLAGRMTLTQGSGRTLVVNSLDIDARGAALDLTDNAMIIDYAGPSPGAAIEELRTDLRDGALFSSTAVASGVAATRLAYADNRVLQLGSFAGETFPPGDFTQLLVKSTFAGDTNLDGQVDMTDLASLATHWQSVADWTSGDSDYSGFIDITDLGLLATNWQAGAASLNEALASLGMGSVPEPSAVIAAAAAFVTAVRRRGRLPL